MLSKWIGLSFYPFRPFVFNVFLFLTISFHFSGILPFPSFYCIPSSRYFLCFHFSSIHCVTFLFPSFTLFCKSSLFCLLISHCCTLLQTAFPIFIFIISLHIYFPCWSICHSYPRYHWFQCLFIISWKIRGQINGNTLNHAAVKPSIGV